MTKELHGPRPDHTLTTIRAKEREPSEKARLSLFLVSGVEGETSRGRNVSGAGGSLTIFVKPKPPPFLFGKITSNLADFCQIHLLFKFCLHLHNKNEPFNFADVLGDACHCEMKKPHGSIPTHRLLTISHSV